MENIDPKITIVQAEEEAKRSLQLKLDMLDDRIKLIIYAYGDNVTILKKNGQMIHGEIVGSSSSKVIIRAKKETSLIVVIDDIAAIQYE